MRLCVAALALCQIGQYLGEKDAFVFCQLSLDRTLTRSNAAAVNWCAASNGGPDGSRRGRTPFELGDLRRSRWLPVGGSRHTIDAARGKCLDQTRRLSAIRNTASTPHSRPRDDGSP